MGPFSPSQLKSWLGVLRQPGYIAALASVGVHGVLFGAGPSFSSLDQGTLTGAGTPGEERRVPLVELTPEEQSRLPDFSSSPYSIYPGMGSEPFDLLPVPNSSSSSGSGGQSAPTMPPNPFAIGMNPYIPPSRPTVVIPPRRTGLPPTTQLPRPNRSNPGQPAPGTPARGNNPASTPTASTPTASTPTAGSPEQPRTPGADDLRPREGDAVAAGPREAQGDTPAAPQGESSGNADRNLRDQVQALAYNPTGTTEEEATTARQDWIETVQEEASVPDLEVDQRLELPVAYQGRICLSPAPVDGLIGVWVEPDGDLGADPTVLRSTGYGLLNEQAAGAIANFDFPENSTPTAYEFAVKVNYDSESCIDREQLLKSSGSI